jgi:hypothetical protein
MPQSNSDGGGGGIEFAEIAEVSAGHFGNFHKFCRTPPAGKDRRSPFGSAIKGAMRASPSLMTC